MWKEAGTNIKVTAMRLLDFLKNRSIRFVISSAIVLITTFALMFFSLTLYNQVTNIAEQNAALNTRQIIDQINLNMSFYFRGMMKISDSLGDLIYYSKDVHSDELKQQIDVIMKTRNDIVALAVFSENGELISGAPLYNVKSGSVIKAQDWFTSPLKEPANLYFSSPHVQNIFESHHSWVISLSREIWFNINGKREKGVLLVDMNFNSIDQLCQNARLGNRGYIFIVDSDSNIVYHPQQQLINAGLKSEDTEGIKTHVFGRYYDHFNGEERLITIEPIEYCRWRTVGIAYMDEIVTSKNQIEDFILWALLLEIIFIFIISAFISTRISNPIKKLERSMKLVEQGIMDINIDVKGEAEVVQLSKAYNLMLQKIRSLMDQIVAEQETKRKSEFEVLQAQINPHFLYNTLNSVVRMMGSSRNEEAITMITSISKLFRISLSKGKSIITVQEEIEHVRNYLIIQSLRYKNKFTFDIQAEDEVLECRTIKLILQPIVENSIYHGLEHLFIEGKILVTASKADGKLLFQITDNGLGIRRPVLEDIMAGTHKSKEGSGVGLVNIQQRIQLYYGKPYGIEVESEPEAGTTVKIWLPLIREDRKEET